MDGSSGLDRSFVVWIVACALIFMNDLCHAQEPAKSDPERLAVDEGPR
jgi:hypothetical protein